MKYLVPYDFTPITRNALDHARSISKAEPGEIELLHIISDESERENADTRFRELLSELNGAEEKITTKVKVGDIFKDISKEAEDANTQLLIMGTHGAKGLQKVLGSHAIKVVTSSNTPFIITQKKEPSTEIKKIVLPVDLSLERVQIAKFASDLAKKFDAEVHIVSKPQKDEFLNNRIKNNISKVRRLFKKDDIPHQISTLDGKKSLHKEVIKYGDDHKADLFAIAYFPESVLPQFEKFSQEMITNDPGIPVLIVNVKEVAGVKNYSFVGI